MEPSKQEFEDIVKSNNPDLINDLLIKLSESPKTENFTIIDYLIDNLEDQLFEKIKLNLVFLIGEIAKTLSIDTKYLDFLFNTYYTSDRWIRDEIIKAIAKISEKTVIAEKIIKLVGYGINDDYLPIRISALKTILKLDNIPLSIHRNIFLALNSKEKELEAICAEILTKHLSDYTQLYNSLSYSESYKILKPKAIRALLLIYFISPFNLESVRENISTSNWEDSFKEKYLEEIDTYEKILLKKI
jgi:hypothetical protein